MKKEIAEEWVSALRSGKYKQGTLKLRRGDDAFCCLGVLCDLAEKKMFKGGWRFDDNGYDFLGARPVLPNDVAKWAGMSSCNGHFKDEENATLSYLNDNGFSFEEIAKVIEQNMEAL